MGFLERILGFGSNNKPTRSDIAFGRYSDAYKSDAQLAAFERSLVLFEQGAYLEAYRAMLTSLKDETVDNITWREEDKTLYFEFWQGSQRITGLANADKIKAESKVARADDLNVGFLRRLVTANFSLKFSRFAL